MPSKQGELNKLDWIKIGQNFLKFVAPTIAIFFALLAQGVALEKAWPVAVFALYQSLSDIFSKLNSGK